MGLQDRATASPRQLHILGSPTHGAWTYFRRLDLTDVRRIDLDTDGLTYYIHSQEQTCPGARAHQAARDSCNGPDTTLTRAPSASHGHESNCTSPQTSLRIASISSSGIDVGRPLDETRPTTPGHEITLRESCGARRAKQYPGNRGQSMRFLRSFHRLHFGTVGRKTSRPRAAICPRTAPSCRDFVQTANQAASSRLTASPDS